MKRMTFIQLFKHLFLFATVALCFQFSTNAQAPLQFNYQAVARDNRGVPMAGKDIRIRFTILNESINGNVEYMEIRKIQTNLFGMFSVSIGSEGAIFNTGSLSNVNWATGKKFLKAEIDPTGSNRYIDLGATQLVSVPYALFALKTLESPGMDGGGFSGAAGNGLSITDSTVMLGNEWGTDKARLSENRYLPLNNHSVHFKDGISDISFAKQQIEIQQDSILMEGETRNSGGVFLKVNPIFPRPDALPFLFSRIATLQHEGTTSPNEVVLWGHNIGPGGGAYIGGLPGIGYSIESNFIPSPNERWLESHEFYITPQGQQVRLKSYTIKANSNYVDFYHSVDNFYLKNPRSSSEYFGINTNNDNSIQALYLGNLNFNINKPNNQSQISNLTPDGELYILNNWRYVFLPGLILQKDGLVRISKHIAAEADNFSLLGDRNNRFASVNALDYYGKKMILNESWESMQNIQPTATLDIEGLNGFNQFRLRKTYTPSSSTDPNGNTGDMAWDENYIYIKTAAGWKRTTLENF